jgi:thioredoxin 1
MLEIASEQELVLDGFCVVKFFSKDCAPCKRLVPILQKMEREFPEAKFLSVDIDEFINLTKKYKIMTLPTIVMFKDNVEVGRITNSINTEIIRKEIKKVS